MKTALIFLLSIISLTGFSQTLLPNPSNVTAKTINDVLGGSIGAYGTDTYTGSLTGLTTYTNFKSDITFTNANTGSATFNLNSLGAKTLKKWSGGSLVNLVVGDISSGQTIPFKYNGTYLVMMSGSGTSQSLKGGSAIKIVNDSINLGGIQNRDFNLDGRQDYAYCIGCDTTATLNNSEMNTYHAYSVGNFYYQETNNNTNFNILDKGLEFGKSDASAIGSTYSFSGGTFTSAGVSSYGIVFGSGFSLSKPLLISGFASFNFSRNTTAQTAGHGALADESGILGGRDINIPSNATGSTVSSSNALKVSSGVTYTHHSDNLRIKFNSYFGGTTVTPTSFVHIGAGTSALAPLGLTSGTDLTTPVAGKFEYNGSRLAFSPSTTRKRIPLSNDAAPTNGQILIGNGTDYTVASLTAGSNVTITPGSGTITIASSGGGGSTDTTHLSSRIDAVKTIIGDVYLDNFSGGMGSYTNTGSGTAAVSGGTLNISGGTLATTSNFVSRNITTSFDDFYRVVRFKVNANVTGEAIGIGAVSVNVHSIPQTVYVTLNTSSTTNRGQIKIHAINAAGTNTIVATSAQPLSYTNGDVLEFYIYSHGIGITEVTARDITTPANAYVSFKPTNNTSAVGFTAVFAPAFYPLGGDWSVISDRFGSNSRIYPLLVKIGDSITEGCFSGTQDRDAGYLQGQVDGRVQVYACGGNTAQDMYNSITYLIAMKPKYVAIRLGVNDIAQSVSLGTVSTSGTYLYYMNLIVAQCLSNGTTPIILYITPATSFQSTINTWNAALTSTFGSICLVLDDATQLKAGGSSLATPYDAGDGLHISALGHSLLANTLVSSGYLPVNRKFGNYSNLTFDGSQYNVNGYTVNTGNTGFGDLPASTAVTGTVGGLSFLTSAAGLTTDKLGAYYFNGSTYKSAWEFVNTTGSALGTLSLMKGGGTISTAANLTGTGTGHFDGAFTVGTTAPFKVVPDVGSTGEFTGTTFALFEGANAGGIGIVPDQAGTAGNKTILAIWDGSQYRSMFETQNVSSGTGTVTIAKSGGTVNVGPLAGSGTRVVTADASGNLGAATFAVASSIPSTAQASGRNLALGDNGSIIVTSNSSAISITIPTGLAVGFSTKVAQGSTGAVTVSGAGGTTVVGGTAGTAITTNAGDIVEVYCTGTNTYLINKH